MPTTTTRQRTNLSGPPAGQHAGSFGYSSPKPSQWAGHTEQLRNFLRGLGATPAAASSAAPSAVRMRGWRTTPLGFLRMPTNSLAFAAFCSALVIVLAAFGFVVMLLLSAVQHTQQTFSFGPSPVTAIDAQLGLPTEAAEGYASHVIALVDAHAGNQVTVIVYDGGDPDHAYLLPTSGIISTDGGPVGISSRQWLPVNAKSVAETRTAVVLHVSGRDYGFVADASACKPVAFRQLTPAEMKAGVTHP